MTELLEAQKVGCFGPLFNQKWINEFFGVLPWMLLSDFSHPLTHHCETLCKDKTTEPIKLTLKATGVVMNVIIELLSAATRQSTIVAQLSFLRRATAQNGAFSPCSPLLAVWAGGHKLNGCEAEATPCGKASESHTPSCEANFGSTLL